MPLDEPTWWYGAADSLPARLLRPLARVYDWQAIRRMDQPAAYRSPLPVLCIGNFTAGGTGKTPLARACVAALAARGRTVAVLTRGYGGRSHGPRFVDMGLDRAEDVGDEPLLLAGDARVMVARDRVAGARAIESATPTVDVIVMDDGLQNPSLAKDLSLAVIDGRRGVGNGRVIPAGPLRASLAAQLTRVDAIVVNLPPGLAGEDSVALTWLRQNFEGPVLAARAEPAADTDALAGQAVVAFAGIANPGRFFDLLESHGAAIADRMVFADHHPFSDSDAERLLAAAAANNARLVTTEKDQVRLIGHGGARGRLRERVLALPIRLVFAERDRLRLEALLEGLKPRPARPAPTGDGATPRNTFDHPPR